MLDDNGEPPQSTPTKDALAALVFAKSAPLPRNPTTGRLTLATAALHRKPTP